MSKGKRLPKGGSNDYTVGKGRPPREHQWKPGESGNPKGRRKGSKNRKTIVRDAERRTFPVNRGGRKSKMTSMEFGFEYLQQDIARGDRKAFLDYIGIVERYSDRDEITASMKDLLAEDAEILANLLARMKRKKTKPKGEK